MTHGTAEIDVLDRLPEPFSRPAHSPDAAQRKVAADARDAKAAELRSVDGGESRACAGVFLSVRTDLDALEAEWRTFETRAECTPFQCFDWAARWQRHIGQRIGARPAIVLGRDADGDLLFIFQLGVERHGLVRRLTWLGSRLCDYNGPLLSPRFPDRIGADRFALLWSEILTLVHADRRLRFDIVDLSKMPEMIGSVPNPFMALKPTLDPSGAHLANLGASWDAYYAAKRSAATRKRERRQFKRLADFGEVRFVEPEAREEIEQTLETLFVQKAGSFARMGVENFLARPGHHAFFRDIATDPRIKAMTHVSRLDVGPVYAATNFGLAFRGRYYLLLSSYQDGEISRHGPGRAHLQALLARAIDKGLTQFDFTIGDEAYKRDWSDVTVPLYGHFVATSPRGWPVVLGTIAFRRLKRAIKQNPRLFHLFREARARIRRRLPDAADKSEAPEA